MSPIVLVYFIVTQRGKLRVHRSDCTVVLPMMWLHIMVGTIGTINHNGKNLGTSMIVCT